MNFTVENYLSLTSLIVTLGLVILNQLNNKKTRDEQEIVNRTMLDQWKQEKEAIDKEQFEDISRISDTLGKLDYNYKLKIENLEQKTMKLELKMEGHEKLINEISQTLKDLPKAISNQITKEISSLKELFEEKIENLKSNRRN